MDTGEALSTAASVPLPSLLLVDISNMRIAENEDSAHFFMSKHVIHIQFQKIVFSLLTWGNRTTEAGVNLRIV